ncbi:MAG: uracil-DNA glycosylase [Clostridia bacterium]|nr:uracil-DNA glycosylase [Clostridia bacterium]
MKDIFKNGWSDFVLAETQQPYYKKLREFLKDEYKTKTIYPDMFDIFNALRWTDLKDVKVVILGQDPYHDENQAHGLAFSVKPEVALPPSLKNIYKEIESDLGVQMPKCGYLKSWAEQGVLLLNTVLTVVAHRAGSHQNMGWEIFTNHIIEKVAAEDRPIVFILWGNKAKEKMEKIKNPSHLIISSAHPSPLSASRGFFGSRPFSKTNDFLIANNIEPIDWSDITVE